MRISFALVFLLLLFIAGCSQNPAPAPVASQTEAPRTGWPEDWSRHLGETVTLEGKAANAKLGALLMGAKDEIWIDGLDAWPNGFYKGSDKGKRLKVTGTVIKRDDMPV